MALHTQHHFSAPNSQSKHTNGFLIKQEALQPTRKHHVTYRYTMHYHATPSIMSQ
jgi:hypothetical protein